MITFTIVNHILTIKMPEQRFDIKTHIKWTNPQEVMALTGSLWEKLQTFWWPFGVLHRKMVDRSTYMNISK